jgi:two-component system NtrC family sensor kinase
MGAVTAPPRARVLVADDEPQLLRLLVRVLERAGYGVVAAADGREALAALAPGSAPVDAVVLDAALAPGGARAVLERVGVPSPEPGVVLMSGDQIDAALQAALLQRGGRFLRKPFLPAALLAAVDEILAGRGTCADSRADA